MELVDIPPLLIFALLIIMATMHFHKAQTCIFKTIFWYLRGPKEQLGRR